MNLIGKHFLIERCWVKTHSCLAAIFIYAAFVWFVLPANPFSGETVAPTGLLSYFNGWKSVEFDHPRSHPERSDLLDTYIPQAKVIKEQLRAGDFSWWNPVTSHGHPGYLEPSRGLLTPFFLIFALIEDDAAGYYCSIFLKLFFAALGMFLFLRHWIRFYPAIFGGCVFALCGFNAAWLYWSQVGSSAWIPWFLWATAGWFVNFQVRYLPAIALSYILLFLGGFPVIAVYASYVVIPLILLLIIFDRHARNKWIVKSLSFAITIGCAVAVLAVPIFALLDMLSNTDLSYRQGGTALGLDFKTLALMIYPYSDGLPRVERTFSAGIVATALAPLGVYFGAVSKGSCRAVSVFSFLLFLLFVLVGLGSLPHSWIRVLPGIGHNPWSRLSIVFGLAVAIASATALSYFFGVLKRLPNKYCLPGLILLVGVSCAQIVDQTGLFRAFNQVSNSHDFFPLTPSLDFVTRKIEPLQGVVADNSYLVSGTLGYYGLREWYAHAFRNEEEKGTLSKSIDRPFATRTAAMFNANQVRFESDLFERLGIRYLLLDANGLNLHRRQEHKGNVLTTLMSGEEGKNQLHVDLRSDVDIEKVGMYFAMYNSPGAPGDIKLRIIDERTGQIMSTATVPAEDVMDSRETIFNFDDPVPVSAGKYILDFSFKRTNFDRKIALWHTPHPTYQGDGLLLEGTWMPHTALLYKIYASKQALAPKWKVADYPGAESNIVVYENIKTPLGPYWIPALKEDAPISADHVKLVKMDAENIVVDYSGHNSGYVVIPSRWFSGWAVRDSMGEYTPEKYLGMLLAHKVDGPNTLTFSYQPAFVRRGILLCIFGLFAFCLLCWGIRRYQGAVFIGK